jgi:protein-disulfide isomerase
MDKKFWAIVGVIIVVFIGFLVFRNDSDQATTTANAKPSNHVKGEGTKVALVEYGDFQCGPCATYYPIIAQVLDKYGQDITFQFRNFPIISIHPNSFAASRAAESASKQGKFWEMYDKLFANQAAWSASRSPNSFFESYANEIGLDLATYREDYKSDEVNGTVRADLDAGKKQGVSATPTFFVNGEAIETPPATLEAFSAIIDKAIADSKTE